MWRERDIHNFPKKISKNLKLTWGTHNLSHIYHSNWRSSKKIMDVTLFIYFYTAVECGQWKRNLSLNLNFTVQLELCNFTLGSEVVILIVSKTLSKLVRTSSSVLPSINKSCPFGSVTQEKRIKGEDQYLIKNDYKEKKWYLDRM